MKLQLTFIASILAFSMAAHAQDTSDGEQAEKYQECLSKVEENSATAILSARKWYIEGGAVAAQHCEALALYDQKRYSEAASLFETIVGKLTRDEGVGVFAKQNKKTLSMQLNYLAGLAWQSDGNYDRAYNVLSAAITGLEEGSGYGYELFIERGLVQFASENYDDAVDDFASALELNSEKVDAFLYRAETFRKMGEHLKARLDLNAALTLEPNHPDVLFESGANFRMLNNDEKALLEWEALIKKYPNSHWQKLAEENIALIGQ